MPNTQLDPQTKEELIKLNIEIEGLLRILADHDNPKAAEMLKDKVNQFMMVYQGTMAWKQNITPEDLAAYPDVAPADDKPKATAAADEGKDSPFDVEPMRLDQMLTNRSAKDFSKAFTVNDRYRFTRELFDNHTSAFDAALVRINALGSLGEAYDYLLNDLEWDPENEAVKDFINIVSNHFNTI